MSHYLAYVYGPKDKETLARVMRPYNEQWECPETGGMRPELVMLENVPVMTLETSLFDMITAFRKVTDKKANYNKCRPIILVDDAYDYLDVGSIRELDAFVVAYDLDSKTATAKILVSRAFWDWWVVGGRWPIQFEGKHKWGLLKNIVAPAEVSWAVDKAELAIKQEGRYTSLRFGEIDWDKAKRERVKNALETWEVIYKVDPTLEPVANILKRMNLPKGARYYSFDHAEYDAWHKRVVEIVNTFLPGWSEGMFSPYDLAGMSRRQVIRYAIARTYIAAIGVFYEEGYSTEKSAAFTQTTVYDWSFFEHPTDQEVKEVLKRIRNLDPGTVVTAVDIHN